jgi:glycosyltransferase involved in cell wall biosynthesis
MRVLWFSNKVLSDRDTGSTGTWLGAMAQALVASSKVELCNVSTGAVHAPVRQDAGPIRQWVVPAARLGRDGLPPGPITAGIIEVVKGLAPDLVHIWGTENYWGLLTSRGLLQAPALLEIQGLKEPSARVFAGGLSAREQLACIGIKEIIKQRSIASGRKAFEQWSRFEREILAGHRFITTQAPWVEAWVQARSASARIFHTELMLRAAFYDAQPWRPSNAPVIFCSAAYPVPYKGIHDAVRAVALLKRRFPQVRLRIAGALQARGIRLEGYMAWVNRLAASLHLTEQIDWLGPLSATEIVKELQGCACMLMPSHCETYCVALAEALYLGVPSVSAYTGGTSWLARDEAAAVFFAPGDEVMCAYQLGRVLTDKGLAGSLSDKARAEALVRNNPDTVVHTQLSIYQQVMAAGTG